ncbi:hypothetical protein [Mesorhizobium jarvisii]|uniref:hypothetical protein n=1 Tax=Mesorhizobium jarvisii TaxID=1777867 RepID=UPI000A662363|nr:MULTISPECIES: hypothetical protein [Mesorhizobium]
MTVEEFLATLSAEDGGCELKVVIAGKRYAVERAGLMNVDLLPDPETYDLEVHLFAGEPDHQWGPHPERTAMLNASANPIYGVGFPIAIVILISLFIVAGLFAVASMGS